MFDIGRLSGTIGRRRIGAHFVQKIDERAIGGQLDLAAQAIKEMRAPFREIDDARREPLRMQRQPHRIQRRFQEIGGDPFVQFRQRAIARDDAPLPVEREGGVGLLALQHEIDRAAGGRQCGIGQRPFRENRCIARRHQEHVALAHRHVKLFGEMQQHVAARMGAAGFDKAQMPGRDPGVAGEIELAQAPALPPLTQQSTDGLSAIEHDRRLAPAWAPFKLPRR